MTICVDPVPAASRCGTSAFRSSSSDWKRKATTDAQTLNEYAELFGEDQAGVREGDQDAGNADMAAGQDGEQDGEGAMSVHASKHEVRCDDNLAVDVDGHQPSVMKKNMNSQGVEADQQAQHGASQAPVPHVKKSKSAKRKERRLNDSVPLLGDEVADAPWADEPVPTSPEVEGVGHQNGMQAKKKQKRDKLKQDKQNKDSNETVAKDVLGTKEAMALLGFASAPGVLSKKKKSKAKKA